MFNPLTMSENLFSYGTLQQDNVQLKLFGRLLYGTKDILKGYRISTIEIMDEAFLSKGEEKIQSTVIASTNDNDRIEGTVFLISEKELFLADNYEPENYTRMEVMLASGKKAWVYAANIKT
jgi:gamma-glutamylcyclotransferase (GGCT)/AIG2-like uncharacterized protein YtfP